MLWSIPGQTFVLRVIENGRSEGTMLRPLADTAVPVGSMAEVPDEKGRP